MKIAVVIVSYNSSPDTIEAVRSVMASRTPNLWQRKIYVVENGSKKESEWEDLQGLKSLPGVELLKSGKNLGFTGGNNLATAEALSWGADFVLLLNTDTKVAADFLIELVDPFLQDQKLGIASPKIYFYPGFEFHKDRYTEADRGKVIWYGGGIIDWENVVGRHRRVDEVDSQIRNSKFEIRNYEITDFATGCCMLIRREVLEKVGMLDDKLFFSWEDTDYSVRVRKAGFKVGYVPRSVIWHKNANTSGGAGSPIQDYYQTRNRLIFAFRYAEWKVKILLLWTLLRTANKNRLRAIWSAMGASC